MSDAWKTRRRVPQTRDSLEPPGWYSRGYLPHFDGGEIPQTVTFCLFDSLPRALLEEWRIELSHLARNEAEVERRKLIEAYLDRGAGSAFMNDPAIAKEIQTRCCSLMAFVTFFLRGWSCLTMFMLCLRQQPAGNWVAFCTHGSRTRLTNVTSYLDEAASFGRQRRLIGTSAMESIIATRSSTSRIIRSRLV